MADYYIQGKAATAPEYLIGKALEQLDIDYIFQYELWGGNRVRGGVLIDFLLFTPKPTPMEHYEQHWHSGTLGSDDRLRLARIAQYFNVPEVILIYGNEVESDTPLEDVVSIVRRKVGTIV